MNLFDKIFRKIHVSQFPDRETVDRQSDIRAIVLSIPRVTALRTLRRPVTAKPSDTRPDVRGKAPARAPCRTQIRQPPSGTIVVVRARVSVRVTRCNARRILRQRAACGRNRDRRSKVERSTRGRKQRFQLCRVFDIRDDRCSTLTTARFDNVYCRAVKNKRHSCISLCHYFRMSFKSYKKFFAGIFQNSR